VIDIRSKSDCEEVIRRIVGTLSKSGFSLSTIQQNPSPFLQDDTYIFDGLCKAVLSAQADWDSVEPKLPAIRKAMSNYNIAIVANLPDRTVEHLYKGGIERLNIRARFLRQELFYIRDNAKTFLKIRQLHGSVWQFMMKSLNKREYDESKGFYLRPNDDDLIRHFTKSGGGLKLCGVGLAICCEFFNNVGIDELKPDGNIITVLVSIGVVGKKSKGPKDIRQKGAIEREDPKDVRRRGLAIAETLAKPRKYVDRLLWNFGREICTKEAKCCSCFLRQEVPALCVGL
jgi:3-methyladenine DNA glycosylase Tag